VGVLVMEAAHAATVARLTSAPPQHTSGSDSCPLRVKAWSVRSAHPTSPGGAASRRSFIREPLYRAHAWRVWGAGPSAFDGGDGGAL